MIFKTKEVEEGFYKISPVLQYIVKDIELYCVEHFKLPFIVITESLTTKIQDDIRGRKSDSHRTKRAVDIRNRLLSIDQQEELQEYFDDKYSHVAALSPSTLLPALVIIKRDHLHVQVRRDIDESKFFKEIEND